MSGENVTMKSSDGETGYIIYIYIYWSDCRLTECTYRLKISHDQPALCFLLNNATLNNVTS